MKKYLFGLILAFASVLALALPTPNEIESMLANKNYSDARGLVQQVLKAKPDSARAHLLNAFILIHVDKNKAAANEELQTAVSLDKKGDVKSSPMFGRLVAEIDAQPAAPAATVTKSQPPPSQASNEWPLIFLALAGVLVFIGIGAYLFRRNEPNTTTVNLSGGAYPTGSIGAGPVVSPSPSGGYVSQPLATTAIIGAGQSASMGAFGTAAAVAGGVVAGSVVSDMIRNRSRDDEDARRRREDEDSRRRDRSSYGGSSSDSFYSPTPTPTPTPEPSPVSYENERSSFSSGSDSSWGSSDSSSSSSSSDSGSSDW